MERTESVFRRPSWRFEMMNRSSEAVVHSGAVVSRVLAVCAVLSLLTLAPLSAAAAPPEPNQAARWIVLEPMARGVNEHEAATFRDLLQSTLSAKPGVRFAPHPPDPCGDEQCAYLLANRSDASVAVFSLLGRLGDRVSILVQVLDLESGDILWQDRMAIAGTSELDVAADRMGRAIVAMRSVEDSRTLGSVSRDEAAQPVRMDGTRGVTLGLLASFPLGTSFGDGQLGYGGSLGYWYEGSNFSIEPRFTFRAGGSEPDESNGWTELGFDIGGYWLPHNRAMTPFVGGGIGLHHMSARRVQQTGTAIVTETLGRMSGWGTGIFVRGGVYLMRTWRVRLSLVGDINVTFKTVASKRSHYLISFGPVVHF